MARCARHSAPRWRQRPIPRPGCFSACWTAWVSSPACGRRALWTPGDELRLGCPTAKPILVYLALRERVPLGARIARWFPEDKGFTRSRDIEVQHLMLNSSGIRDYVPMLVLHPDSAVTVDATIDRAYRGKALLFDPGSGFEYSNTNFNLLGRLLEIETGLGLDSLVRTSFASVAPSLRYDDGHGRYPRGYAKPWPYHWSCPGYGGGLIGTATDAMRAFAWIATQPEFKRMTRWSKPDGSPEQSSLDHLLGLGLFGRRDLAGRGEAAFYDGDIGPCQMILARVRGSCLLHCHDASHGARATERAVLPACGVCLECRKWSSS